jgi:hypothetical protein
MSEILVTEDQVLNVVAEGDQVITVEIADTQEIEIATGDEQIVVVDGTDTRIVNVVSPATEIVQVNAIETGPQGPPGSEAFPEPGIITRDEAGQITQIRKQTKIISLTRVDGRLNSVTDGEYTISFHRGPDGAITGWDVVREGV